MAAHTQTDSLISDLNSSLSASNSLSDDTQVASMPTDIPIPPPKRAVRTYGKPKPAADATDTIPDTPLHMATSISQPPRTETQNASDSEDASPSSPKFAYGWMAQLKAIDEGEDIEDVLRYDLGKKAEKRLSDVTRGKLQANNSLSSLRSEAPSISSQTLADSQVRQATSTDNASRGSDTDSPSKNSFQFNSPAQRSFDTPPTSPMGQLALENLEDSEPEFQGDAMDTSGDSQVKTKSGKSKEKPRRTKRATKKEEAETRKETARLLANQQVTVPRAQTRPMHTIQSLFSKLKTDVPPRPKDTSDPIVTFSSPANRSLEKAGTRPLREASSLPDVFIKPKKATTPPTKAVASNIEIPRESDEDDEDMPEADTLLQTTEQERLKRVAQERVRAEVERKAKELEERKRKLLQSSKPRIPDSDSDDDLEVEGIVSRYQSGKGRKILPHGILARSPSGRKATALTGRSLELAAKPKFIEEKVNSHRNPRKLMVSQKALNEHLLHRADKQSNDIEEKKKKEWVRAGGTIKEPANASEEAIPVQAWLEKGSMRAGYVAKDEDNDEDGSDYEPADQEDATKEDADDETGEEGEDDENTRGDAPDEEMDVSDEDTDKENLRPLKRSHASRVILESDDEAEVSSRPKAASILVPDSSIIFGLDDSPGRDKENSAELAFSTSDDKENDPVPRHRPRGRAIVSEGLSDEEPSQGGVRHRVALGRLDSDTDAPSVSLPRSTTNRILQVLHEEDKEKTMAPVSPSRNSRSSRESSTASPQNFNGQTYLSPTPVSRRTGSEDIVEGAPMSILGKRGFSQIFFEDKSPLKEKAKPLFQLGGSLLQPVKDDNEFEFTQPNGLLPSVKISATQRREVDEMFGKDQEFKLEEARRQKTEAETTFELGRAEPYFGSFVASQSPQLSPQIIRHPLETLSSGALDTTSETEEDQQPRRIIRERPQAAQSSPSACSPRNAFDILRHAAKNQAKEVKVVKTRVPITSEFVEAEAQESDDELLPGFGDVKDADDEDAADDDPDAVLEDLVDDGVVDVNEQKVLEKHLEHKAADDAAIEKLHRDAVEGKLRAKRRGGEFFSDSDSDDDSHRPRKHFLKKRRIEGDTLDACEKNPETRPFYDAYMKPLDEEDDGALGFLNTPSKEEEQDVDDSDEPIEKISAAEVARQIREAADRNREDEELQDDERDVEDVSWLDQDSDMIDVGDIEIEAGPLRQTGKGLIARDPVLGGAGCQGKKSNTASRLSAWAKQESQSRSASGRAGGFAPKETAGRGAKRHAKMPSDREQGPKASGSQTSIKRSTSSFISHVEKRKGFEC